MRNQTKLKECAEGETMPFDINGLTYFKRKVDMIYARELPEPSR